MHRNYVDERMAAIDEMRSDMMVDRWNATGTGGLFGVVAIVLIGLYFAFAHPQPPAPAPTTIAPAAGTAHPSAATATHPSVASTTHLSASVEASR